MKKDNSINETLNKILLEVLSGVDYVSKIALDVKKSIPVVYRQLDVLVDLGILSKNRTGKKVMYVVDWVNLSEIISSTIILDIHKFRKLTNAKKFEKKLLNESQKIANSIPSDLFEDKVYLNKLVFDFFSEEKVKTIFKKYISNLKDTSKELNEYTKIDFKENIDLFLDMFGLMSKDKQKKILSKEIYDKHKFFLDYCRLRYIQKKILDPRSEFLD